MTLLQGAKRTVTALPNTIRYVKQGTLKSAMKEFNSLDLESELKEFPFKKVR